MFTLGTLRNNSASQQNINSCSHCTGATFETEQKPIWYSVNIASVRLIGVIKTQFFLMVMYVFGNSSLSQEIFAIDTYHRESCNMLFGTRSQAHAYDPSDYMETRLYKLQSKCLWIFIIFDKEINKSFIVTEKR